MNNKKLAKEWFDIAQSDFLYAQIGVKKSIVFPQVAFLSQQVAEKMLKGLLVLNEIEPPRTHDLTLLLDKLLKTYPVLEQIHDSCDFLFQFYVETRYPSDVPDYTKEEIFFAFNEAKKVKGFIEKIIENDIM